MKTTKQYGKKTDIALSLWVKLARAYATLNLLTAKDISNYGLTPPQFGVLECLGHLGSLPMGEIGRKMLVSGGNITVVVDNLEREGYVERVRNKNDRRTIYVRLTSKGNVKFKEIFPQHAQFINSKMCVLSEKEQVRLANLLKKLGKGIENNNLKNKSDRRYWN